MSQKNKSALQNELELELDFFSKKTKNSASLTSMGKRLMMTGGFLLVLAGVISYGLSSPASKDISQAPTTVSMSGTERYMAEQEFATIQKLLNVDFSGNAEDIRAHIWKNVPEARVAFLTQNMGSSELGIDITENSYVMSKVSIRSENPITLPGANNPHFPLFVVTWNNLYSNKAQALEKGLKAKLLKEYDMIMDPIMKKEKNGNYTLSVTLREIPEVQKNKITEVNPQISLPPPFPTGYIDRAAKGPVPIPIPPDLPSGQPQPDRQSVPIFTPSNSSSKFPPLTPEEIKILEKLPPIQLTPQEQKAQEKSAKELLEKLKTVPVVNTPTSVK